MSSDEATEKDAPEEQKEEAAAVSAEEEKEEKPKKKAAAPKKAASAKKAPPKAPKKAAAPKEAPEKPADDEPEQEAPVESAEDRKAKLAAKYRKQKAADKKAADKKTKEAEKKAAPPDETPDIADEPPFDADAVPEDYAKLNAWNDIYELADDEVEDENVNKAWKAAITERRLVIPIIPFMGVRISWLMLAKNSLLAMLAASATMACLSIFLVFSFTFSLRIIFCLRITS